MSSSSEGEKPDMPGARSMILDAVYGFGLVALVAWAIGFACGRFL